MWIWRSTCAPTNSPGREQCSIMYADRCTCTPTVSPKSGAMSDHMTQYSHIYSSALQPMRCLTLHCNHCATSLCTATTALQPPRCLTLHCNHRTASLYAATTALRPPRSGTHVSPGDSVKNPCKSGYVHLPVDVGLAGAGRCM